MRPYSSFRPIFFTSPSRFERASGSVVKGLEGTPRISLVDSPGSLTMPTRPARDSPTFFIITKDREPVSQKSPFRPERSAAIFIYGSRPGAYWISSISTGGVYRCRKSAGSFPARCRTSGSSSVTILRSGSARRSRRVVLPTCRGPVTSRTGNVSAIFLTVSSADRGIYTVFTPFLTGTEPLFDYNKI
jgi:hypothetical protein